MAAPRQIPIRVLLVDDQAMIREGLRRILTDAPDIQVVGQASDGRAAVEEARRVAPDIAILDYTMPGLDGPSATEALRAEMPGVRVLVLTVHDSPHYALAALRAGARGFCTKGDAPAALLEAVRAVYRDMPYVSPALVSQLARFLSAAGDDATRGPSALSPREFQLMRLLGGGKGLGECAAEMGISESAASTYRTRIMTKLDLPSTSAIVRYAIEHDIVG